MPQNSAFAEQIQANGFALAPRVLDLAAVDALRSAVGRLNDGDNVRRKAGVYGVRNLLEMSPEVRELARSLVLRDLVTQVLGPGCFAVRGIFFDKIPGANWKLAWHQDSVIAVKERRDAPGFKAWSQKAGVWQTEPPAEVMAGMLALRVHLDDCGADNGPLRVIPGSHRNGWLDGQFDRWKAEIQEVICEARCGDVLAMRPLLLHASSPANLPSHRRVIHLEYAATELPGGLEWYDRVG
jgi:ectoine hydroxylase-related dioxygenase (phytanoyl-CoA dioxygenase family)